MYIVGCVWDLRFAEICGVVVKVFHNMTHTLIYSLGNVSAYFV